MRAVTEGHFQGNPLARVSMRMDRVLQSRRRSDLRSLRQESRRRQDVGGLLDHAAPARDSSHYGRRALRRASGRAGGGVSTSCHRGLRRFVRRAGHHGERAAGRLLLDGTVRPRGPDPVDVSAHPRWARPARGRGVHRRTGGTRFPTRLLPHGRDRHRRGTAVLVLLRATRVPSHIARM
jgi:hypothetical protein